MRIIEIRGIRALTTVLLLGLAGCGPDLGSELAAEDEELLEATSALSYPAPGITYSRLTATNRVFHVVTAKLTNGRVRVRATRPDEVQQLTTTFARSVNA